VCNYFSWIGTFVAAVLFSVASQAAEKTARPGIKEVQASLSALTRTATIDLGGDPDWMAVGPDAVWISVSRQKAVYRINVATNQVAAKVEFPGKPGSGLALGFGSLWVPIDATPTTAATLARVEVATNSISALIPAGPADSEGGITTSADSVWLITDKSGTLSRIDPATNTVRQKISVPAGSFNPLHVDGSVWVSGTATNELTAVDAATGEIRGSTAVGPRPRFLTGGAGSIWTLNQGDGSITRVDAKSRAVVSTIPAGIPGGGGEICFGAGAVWATVIGIPLTLVDPGTNKVLRQWTGVGGDSVRFGHESIWLTYIKHGLVWRMPVPAAN